MTMPSMQDYYFSDGRFQIKSKFWKNVRIGMVIGILLGSMFATSSLSNYAPSIPNMVYATKDAKYVDHILSTNKNVSKKESMEIVKSVMKWSNEFDLNEKLILAVMTVESRFDKFAISNAGAMGLMQVMTSVHWKKLKDVKDVVGSPEPFSIDGNIYLGARILKDCTKQFKNVESALLCYNGSNASPNGYDKKVLIAMREL